MPGSGGKPQKEKQQESIQIVKALTTEKQDKSTTIQDKSGKCLTKEHGILNRLTEYCSDLYMMETQQYSPQIPGEEHHPILRGQVEAAAKSLKMGKITYQQS